MPYSGSSDINWHHKEVTLLDFKWVRKVIVVHVEVRQFEEKEHEGKPPSIVLSRHSAAGHEDLMIVAGRAAGHLLVSLDHEDKLIAKVGNNPNSAGTVKWEFVG